MPNKTTNPTPVIDIEFIGGNCPVQAEGTVNGIRFYFCARREVWRMNIGGVDNLLSPQWSYSEECAEAGWLNEEEAISFIRKSAQMFVNGVKSDGYGVDK